MIDLDNQSDFNIDIASLEEIKKEITSKDIELLITNNKEIQILNFEHRGKDKPTDVLSFPLDFMFENMPIGSIVISIDFVKDKAKEYGHSELDELKLLFIHGILHLVGYDHEVDSGEHRQKEEEIIEKFGLPKSLIVRNS